MDMLEIKKISLVVICDCIYVVYTCLHLIIFSDLILYK